MLSLLNKNIKQKIINTLNFFLLPLKIFSRFTTDCMIAISTSSRTGRFMRDWTLTSFMCPTTYTSMLRKLLVKGGLELSKLGCIKPINLQTILGF